MAAADTRELLDRIRASLPDLPVREVRMFGGVAVMLDDGMVVGVQKDGGLLVRVDPAEDQALLERPHASRAEMGAGRSMGAGWLSIAAEALESDEILDDWVRIAVAYRQRPPGKRRD
jgi:TfoX/Sxy family transcriptional regulator of competence genes